MMGAEVVGANKWICHLADYHLVVFLVGRGGGVMCCRARPQ